MFNEEKVHSSWRDLMVNNRDLLLEIEKKIGANFTPNKERVFRFTETDLQKVRCLWLGKDPYPQPNVATGRSFEVSGVKSWDDPKVNRSLQNILKLLHKTEFELNTSLNIDEIREEIRSGTFPIIPPNRIFDHWEKEGVLFLNSALTTEVGTIGKHLKVWSPFFKQVLAYMVEKNNEIIYFLWGDARKYKDELLELGVSGGNIYTSYHPSSFYGDKGGYEYDGKFLQNPCFRDTMNKIKWI